MDQVEITTVLGVCPIGRTRSGRGLPANTTVSRSAATRQKVCDLQASPCTREGIYVECLSLASSSALLKGITE